MSFITFLKQSFKKHINEDDFKTQINKTYNKNKLLSFNEIITSPKILKGICICIFLLIFICVNCALIAFLNIGNTLNNRPVQSLLTFDFINNFMFYFVVIILDGLFVLFLYYKILVSFKDLNVGQKGNARFIFPQEIKEIYKEIPVKDIEFEGIGGLVMARYLDMLYIDNRINNNFILALSRGGKGELQVIPSIDIYSRASIKSSLIINDIKNGELSRATIPHLLKRGYDVKVLDFTNAKKSHKYNLLALATMYYANGDVALASQACKKTAYSLYEDPNSKDRFWIDAPISLFSAVALAHVIDLTNTNEKNKINMYSVTLFISTLAGIKDEKTQESELDKFFMSRPIFDQARLLYTTIKFSEGKTRSSVLSIVFSKLALFTATTIIDITSNHDVDILKLGGFDTNKPMAIFIRLPQNNPDFYPIASMIFNQIHFALTNKANDVNNGKCYRPVKFIGDEIFNGPPLENLSSILSTCLSANISYDFYAQSNSQVADVYGADKAKIILDNCSTKIYIMSDNKETREEISSKLGNKTIKNVTRAGTRFSFDKTLTENFEEKPLLSPKELSELKEGEIVVLQALKRQTLKGEKISSMPIFASGDLSLKYRYEYLSEFDTNADIPYDLLNINDIPLNLSDIVYLPKQLEGLIELDSNTDIGNSSKLLKDTLNSSKLTMIENLLNSRNIDINLPSYSHREFKDIVNSLMQNGDISESEASAIFGLLN